MRTATSPDENERSGEMIALLNMIIYAQAIADDMQLDNTIYYLSSAAQELAGILKEGMQTEISSIMLASLVTSKAGNC
ncbi:hypothetical protein [Rhizobium sp. C4]|uniref:hypothetical protein n=1 Tax=Rhizobium sp. C4 TaxID=1349800 RepID=UPI001E38542B|nr:hypothetical protein [Rhizobium sp. C4]MCD2173640.1 hypothetical protein [Rhizobium sp. C4]